MPQHMVPQSWWRCLTAHNGDVQSGRQRHAITNACSKKLQRFSKLQLLVWKQGKYLPKKQSQSQMYAEIPAEAPNQDQDPRCCTAQVHLHSEQLQLTIRKVPQNQDRHRCLGLGISNTLYNAKRISDKGDVHLATDPHKSDQFLHRPT